MRRFGSLWRWGCLEVRGLDKVGLRYSSVRLIGQVYGGVGVGEIIRSHVPVVAVAMLESRLASCVHWSRLLDWFVKLGVHGMGQRSAVTPHPLIQHLPNQPYRTEPQSHFIKAPHL